MSGHTPGPWYVIGTPRIGVSVVSEAGAILCNPDPIERTDDEIVANARLIAAAPELLAALEDLMCRLDGHFGGPERNMDWKEQERARAAIAAAKDGQP